MFHCLSKICQKLVADIELSIFNVSILLLIFFLNGTRTIIQIPVTFPKHLTQTINVNNSDMFLMVHERSRKKKILMYETVIIS